MRLSAPRPDARRCEAGTQTAPPLPLKGERVGVGGRFHKQMTRGEAPLYLGKWAFWSATGCGRTAAPSRPEARSPLDGKPRMSLELQSHLPYPEQLPGREPASARKGFEDDDAFVLWC